MAKPVFPFALTPRRLAAALWAVAAAIGANLFLPLTWWRPYCRNPLDGPGYNAIGAPFPYAEPTGVSSLEYFWMPQVYGLDVLVIAACVYPILRRAPVPRAMANAPVIRIVAVTGVLALLLLGSLQSLVWTTGWWPTSSLTTGGDRYLDFRPAFLIDPRNDGRCDG